MDNLMFCYQCQQTAHGTGCVGVRGVCGKEDEVANLQDFLTGAMISLSQGTEGKELTNEENRLLLECLFATVTNVNFDKDSIQNYIDRIQAILDKYGIQGEPYDMKRLWYDDNEDIRSLKSLILLGMRGFSAYAFHAMILGFEEQEIYDFVRKGLAAVGADNLNADELLQIVLETGKISYQTMKLLDTANTTSYGNPEPVTIDLAIDEGPFIVVSGHDLKVMDEVLEQTEGKGINVYTHGEMLPALGYPKLREKYPHFKGNFGTAWQNQQREFKDIPAPVIFTSNCLMPPKPSYEDRIYTTEMVGYPQLTHIPGPNHDFTPVIEQALALGGYPEKHPMHGINGGTQVTTGFAHNAVLSHAGEIVQAVKDGKISHFFLVGGCDGASPKRKYFTEFVEDLPDDTVVLTCACGKYRFNDLQLGEVAGLPRLLDLGQCNDSYSGIVIALALADAFECEVNELPLSIVLSWYEQKAVAVLLALLYLDINNIVIGPTLPAFVSPNVWKILQDQFGMAATTTPEEDIARLIRSED